MSKEYELTKEAWSKAIKNKAARKLLWDILSMAGIYSDCFDEGKVSSYLEGRRSIGLEILAILDDIDPNIYPKLLLEYVKINKETKEGDKNE